MELYAAPAGLLVDHPMTVTAAMASQGSEHFAVGLDAEHQIANPAIDPARKLLHPFFLYSNLF